MIPSLEEVRAPDPTPSGPGGSPARTPTRTVGVGLGAALAGLAGAQLMATAEAPQCGQTRSEELSAHAGAVERAAQRADLTRVLREVGLATGILRHGSTSLLIRDVTPAGAMPVTQDLPVEQPVPEQPPVVPQIDPPQPVPGGMMRNTPLPHETQPTQPRVQTRLVRPNIQGGARAVQIVPPGRRGAR